MEIEESAPIFLTKSEETEIDFPEIIVTHSISFECKEEDEDEGEFAHFLAIDNQC